MVELAPLTDAAADRDGAPLVVWAQPVVRLLLGGCYGDAVLATGAMAPYAFLLGLAALLSLMVNCLGEAPHRLVWPCLP